MKSSLQFSKNSWRAADIAVIKKSIFLPLKLMNKISVSEAPEYVIELLISKWQNLKKLKTLSGLLDHLEKTTDLMQDFMVSKRSWVDMLQILKKPLMIARRDDGKST